MTLCSLLKIDQHFGRSAASIFRAEEKTLEETSKKQIARIDDRTPNNHSFENF
jgi:hypothetical protein